MEFECWKRARVCVCERESDKDLSQVWVVVVLLFDPQQHRRVPLIQARDAVIVFNSVSESVDILFFKMFLEYLLGQQLVATANSKSKVNPP